LADLGYSLNFKCTISNAKTRRSLTVAVSCGVLLFPASLLAHVTDTSLLRVSVLQDRLRTELNLDLQTLNLIHPVDSDGNGEVERSEFEKQLPLFQRFFQEQVKVTFEGSPPKMLAPAGTTWQSASSRIPSSDLRNAHVEFVFETDYPAGTPKRFRLQPQVFEQFGSNHRILLAVVEGETSDQAVLTQTEPSIEYTPRAPGSLPRDGHSSPPAEEPRNDSGGLQLFVLGVEHILTGYDHLLFLLALLLGATRWRQMLACITAFTCAHSLTLALSALEIARLPDRWVESGIAASIAWVAARNLRTKNPPPGWRETFTFGLIHGFGFASLFRGLRLPSHQFFTGVLTFNLGVEAGQVAILLPVLPLLLAIQSRPWQPAFRKALSGMALLMALFWFLERVRV
jgi:hydrogenase/urease accessory protein HupE